MLGIIPIRAIACSQVKQYACSVYVSVLFSNLQPMQGFLHIARLHKQISYNLRSIHIAHICSTAQCVNSNRVEPTALLFGKYLQPKALSLG